MPIKYPRHPPLHKIKIELVILLKIYLVPIQSNFMQLRYITLYTLYYTTLHYTIKNRTECYCSIVPPEASPDLVTDATPVYNPPLLSTGYKERENLGSNL